MLDWSIELDWEAEELNISIEDKENDNQLLSGAIEDIK